MNRNGAGISEIIFMIFLATALIAPWAIVGLWWWFWLFVGICALVGIWEIASVIKDKKTISQKFWAFGEEHPVKAWLVITMTTVGWFLLMIHLAWKLVT